MNNEFYIDFQYIIYDALILNNKNSCKECEKNGTLNYYLTSQWKVFQSE